MAFTRAPYTSLTVLGVPGPPPTFFFETGTATDTTSVTLSSEVSSLSIFATIAATDTVSASVSDVSSLVTYETSIYRTQLGVMGVPTGYVDIQDKVVATLVQLTSSDGLSVQWGEEPVDTQQIQSADNTRVTLGEVSALFNFLDVSDTASVSVSETIALVQTGVTIKAATDTVSVSVSETSSLNVTLATSDTTSVTFSAETSAVAVSVASITGADTVSVTITDDSNIAIFTGVLAIPSADDCLVALSEASLLQQITPTVPFRIRIIPRTARIRIIAT